MLTRQVSTLMGGIDKVEDQVDVMQTQVVSRDVAIAQKKVTCLALVIHTLKLTCHDCDVWLRLGCVAGGS